MIELLAPAGNLSCALAAFDAGADAVYCGLKKFNARERTENFSEEEMSKLIEYARHHGRRVYVTFNTLVKENEVEEAARELALLDSLGPDAIIVQDLGVVRMARKFFPRLTVHASTQMGLHNSSGLAFAKELGITRVVLERQTTLEELQKMMAAKPPVEVEIFIHGALCCCISGSCMLSSWLGGWSGNRGKCKQPCRRRYHTENGNGFFLSAQDLCMVERIPELMRSGVCSFKIEGRLRRSDYVENVVSAYRLVMDAVEEDPSGRKFREALPHAREILSRTCGRKWSEGYYTGESARNLVKHDAMGVSGLLSGHVTGTTEKGFLVRPVRPLALGDMLRIQPPSGDDGPSLEITRMTIRGKNATFLPRNMEGFIYADKQIPRGGIVYKTSGKARDYSARIAAMTCEPPLLDLEIALNRSRIEVRGGDRCWSKALALAEATKQPLSSERIEAEFAQMTTEHFRPGKMAVQITENPFLPASVLKALRKECGEFFADLQLVREEGGLQSCLAVYREMRPYAGKKVQDVIVLPRGKRVKDSQGAILAREWQEEPAVQEELLLPFYASEGELPRMEEALVKYLKKGGKSIRLASLHQFSLVRKAIQRTNRQDVVLKCCMPLPVCNSMAAAELAEQGIQVIQASPELGRGDLEALCQKSPLPVEVYRMGRPVLLGTRASIAVEGKMQDNKGEEFRVQKEGILTLVLPEKMMEIPLPKGAAASFFDCRHADFDEKGNAHFNFDVSLS